MSFVKATSIDDAIQHCLDVVEEKKNKADKYNRWDEWESVYADDCILCATNHQQLAEWLTELKDLREENRVLMQERDRLIKEKGELLNKVSGGDVLRICQLEDQLKKTKRLLKAAVEDFAKLDRVNTKVRNCMMPDMDCADCPLSWDSVDDSVEPCHNWRYTNEALALIGQDGDTNG